MPRPVPITVAVAAGSTALVALAVSQGRTRPAPVPVVNHSGDLVLGVLLLGAVVLETALWLRGRRLRCCRRRSARPG